MNLAEIYNRNTTQITRSRSRLTQILHFYFFIIFHFLYSVTNVSLGISGKLNTRAEPRERATVLNKDRYKLAHRGKQIVTTQ